jgi:hypothetical protein
MKCVHPEMYQRFKNSPEYPKWIKSQQIIAPEKEWLTARALGVKIDKCIDRSLQLFSQDLEIHEYHEKERKMMIMDVHKVLWEHWPTFIEEFLGHLLRLYQSRPREHESLNRSIARMIMDDINRKRFELFGNIPRLSSMDEIFGM